MTVEVTARKPRGLRSLVGVMKLAAALLTRPVSAPSRPDRVHHRVDLIGVADVANMMRSRY